MTPPYAGDSEELKIFLDELEEMLELTEANLVALEKSPGASELVSEIFRAMHTIKGGAAALGLDDGVRVTHAMETFLDEVRSGSRAADRFTVDLLFSVLDWLKVWRDSLVSGQEGPSSLPVLDAIAKLESGATASQVEVAGAGQSAPLELPPGLAEALETKFRDGVTPAVLKVRFREGAPFLSVRAFQVIAFAEDAADVIGSIPSSEDIEKDAVGQELYVYFAPAERGDAVVRAVSTVSDIVFAGVEPVQLPKGEAGTTLPVSQSGPAARGEEGPDEAQRPQESEGRESSVRPQTDAQQSPVVRKTDLGRTVRVDVSLLDFLMDTVGELVIQRTRLAQIASRLQSTDETAAAGQDVGTLAAHLQRISQELQEGIMRARLLPLKNIFARFPRLVRDLSLKCGKQVRFEMTGEETELDRTVIEAIDDPLIHILRNAVDHGIEAPEIRRKAGKPAEGLIRLSAWHQENYVLIQVEDDGGGVDVDKVKEAAVRKGLMSREAVERLDERQAVELIFLPGFSTAEHASEVSGRGVGMDVVRANLERINGTVEVRTRRGQGTAVTLRLPLTLAIMRALLVLAGGWVYAIPTSSVEEVVDFSRERLETVHGKPTVVVRGRVFPVISLKGALDGNMWDVGHGCQYALLTRHRKSLLAIAVDDLVGEEEIVVKEMGRLLSRVRGVAGATILADGDPAIILDVNYLV